MTSFSDL